MAQDHRGRGIPDNHSDSRKMYAALQREGVYRAVDNPALPYFETQTNGTLHQAADLDDMNVAKRVSRVYRTTGPGGGSSAHDMREHEPYED